MSEFNLSEKIWGEANLLHVGDVKEFIERVKRDIKEEIPIEKSLQYFQGRVDALGIFNNKIDKLAGPKLIK